MEAERTVAQEQRRAKKRMALPSREVVVTDVKMSFWSMVTFMVKWTIAAIPALIILTMLLAITFGALGGIFGGLVGAF